MHGGAATLHRVDWRLQPVECSAHSSSKAVQIELPRYWQEGQHAVLHIPLERLSCCQSVTSLVSMQAVFYVCVLARWHCARQYGGRSLSCGEHEKMALDGLHDDEPPFLPENYCAFRFSQIKLTCMCVCVCVFCPWLISTTAFANTNKHLAGITALRLVTECSDQI